MSEDSLPRKRGRPRRTEEPEIKENSEIHKSPKTSKDPETVEVRTPTKNKAADSAKNDGIDKSKNKCVDSAKSESVDNSKNKAVDSAKTGGDKSEKPMTVFVVSESSMIDMCMIKQEPAELEEPCANQVNDDGHVKSVKTVVKKEREDDISTIVDEEEDKNDGNSDDHQQTFKLPDRTVRHTFVAKAAPTQVQPQQNQQNNKIMIRTPEGMRAIQNPVTILNGNSKKICYIIKNSHDSKNDRTIYVDKPINKLPITSLSKPTVVLEKQSTFHTPIQRNGFSMLKSSQNSIFKPFPKVNPIVIQPPSSYNKEASLLKIASVTSLQAENDQEDDLLMDTSITTIDLSQHHSSSVPVHRKVVNTLPRPDSEFNLKFTNQTGKFYKFFADQGRDQKFKIHC
jgi:hypothetical protein